MSLRLLGSAVFLTAFLLFVILSGRVVGACGDVDNSGSVGIGDLTYSLSWHLGGGPAPPDFDQADCDQHQILTIRDEAILWRFIFGGGAAPNCPPTLPRYVPTNDLTLDVTYATVFPANVTSTNIEIFLTNTAPITPLGLSIPVLVKVDGVTPSALSFTFDGVWPGNLSGTTSISGGPNGHLLLKGYHFNSVSAGTRKLGTLAITMPSSDPLPRTIALNWEFLPPMQGGVPVNEPMMVDDNLVGTIPALNGLFPNSKTGFFAFPAVIYFGNPVFFSGVSTEPVSSWNWDFGDGSPHGTVQNPVHLYTTTGSKTVTLVATLTAGGSETTVKPNYIVFKDTKADFTAIQRLGVAPLSVSFSDQTLGAPDTWLWDFGEAPTGTEDTEQNPSHTYNTPGVYTVALTSSLGASSDTKTWIDCVKVDAVATPDLEVRGTGAPIPRPGFIVNLHLIVRNLGSGDASGSLQLDLSAYPAGTGFVSSVPPPAVNLDPMFEWHFPTISWDPTQNTFDDYEVVVAILIGIGTPPHTMLNAVASIPPVGGEVEDNNNTYYGPPLEVVTAWDPNDKAVQPVCGDGNYARSSERLHYTIFFENKPEATASATYVLIVDTLDPGLDLGSFALGPSSHESVLDFELNPTTREAVWFFDGIELPPNTSPPNGEGFVSFTISPEPGQLDGTVIPNRAHIRFDFEAWLAAPDTGAVTVTIESTDINDNGILDVCDFLCGDADGSDNVDISDAVYLIQYIFQGGPAPNPLLAGDTDCSGIVDISDAVYLIQYIFQGGPAPCASC